MNAAFRRLWDAPRPADPPARVWRDWALLAVVVVSSLVEGLVAAHVPWRPVTLLLAVGCAPTLLWRRTHPLAMLAVAFVPSIAVELVGLAVGAPSAALGSSVYFLVLLYALFRWGSGREIVLGSAIFAVAFVVGMVHARSPLLPDVVAGTVFVSFPALAAVAVRQFSASRERTVEQVRSREREQLARELHDTVAHHVSAIVIRAQAGRVAAAADPAAAPAALEVIEAEAARTLAEMRLLVGALRGSDPGGEGAELRPQAGVADIARLATAMGDHPRVDVQLSGDLDDLGPALGPALYRIAQESITNAVRHAKGATQVDVRVVGEHDRVRCVVQDDGDVPLTRGSGYGVVGMTERVSLLGGTISVGPGPQRGWLVDAVLPRSGPAR